MRRYLLCGIALLLASGICLSSFGAEPKKKDATSKQADTDNVTAYRTLATESLTAFKAGDRKTAAEKAKELEKAWDKNTEFKKCSPDTWKTTDKAMDGCSKPVKDL